MASLNRVFLIGNLTRDPELKYTQSGLAVCEFGLAVNRKYKTGQGEDREETMFADITVFARQAETASEYLSKGRSVFIEGRLKLDQWTNSEGQKRSKLSIVAERVQFLGGRPGASGGAPAAAPKDDKAGNDSADDDIPF